MADAGHISKTLMRVNGKPWTNFAEFAENGSLGRRRLGTEPDSKRAHQNAQQITAEDVGIEQNSSEQESKTPGDFENQRDSLVEKLPR